MRLVGEILGCHKREKNFTPVEKIFPFTAGAWGGRLRLVQGWRLACLRQVGGERLRLV
jgi:hypothetical protein